MGIVIEFQDLVRERRRRQEQATVQRCIDVIEQSLAQTQSLLPSAAPREREVYVRRVEQLSELLEYVQRRG